MCGKEVCGDGDSFYCEGCHASWDADYSGYEKSGQWDDPNELACPSAIKPYDRPNLAPEHEPIRHIVEACILADDHGGKHRAMDSWHKWDDGDPRAVTR